MKIMKTLLNIVLFLGLGTITINAQNTVFKNNNSDKLQQYKVKNDTNNSKTDDTLKQNSEFKNYQKWDSNYAKDKHQQGTISTH
ncbi:MAG: hypothetical protein L3I99_00700 [Sulfurimonas sp.]|nr:hypothetical protein [Sulfurimonas sp.]